MADWTTISDTSVDPDAPLTSQLGYAWRDNPIAIAEGATGAPRILIGAIERLTTGAQVRLRNDGLAGAATGTALDFGILQSGSITVEFTPRRTATTVDLVRIRGGIPTSIYSASGADTARTRTISVLPGDRITLAWTGSNADDGISAARMRTGGADYWPVSIAAGVPEGNTYN